MLSELDEGFELLRKRIPGIPTLAEGDRGTTVTEQVAQLANMLKGPLDKQTQLRKPRQLPDGKYEASAIWPSLVHKP
jgi:hypothetical protein